MDNLPLSTRNDGVFKQNITNCNFRLSTRILQWVNITGASKMAFNGEFLRWTWSFSHSPQSFQHSQPLISLCYVNFWMYKTYNLLFSTRFFTKSAIERRAPTFFCKSFAKVCFLFEEEGGICYNQSVWIESGTVFFTYEKIQRPTDKTIQEIQKFPYRA